MIFLSLAAIWLIGFGVVRWLFPQPLGWSLHNVLLFSLGIGAGAGTASCLYFLLLALAGPKPALLAAVIAVAAVAALALAVVAKPREPALAWANGPATPRYLTGLFWLALALAALMFVLYAGNAPHGEQGAWSIWNLRARFLVRAGASWKDAFSPLLSWSHPDYPLLVPGLVAMCWTLARQESTAAPIAIGFLFTFGTAGVLLAALGALRGKTQALAAGTLLLGTAGFTALGAAQYGDVPLSFFMLAALALLGLEERHPEDLRLSLLAGLMAGFAAWSRNEGLIFVAVLILARAAAVLRFGRRSGLPRQLLALAAGLAPPLAVVIFFKLRLAGPNELLAVKPSTILEHLADPGRWILTIQGYVMALLGVGRFLIPIALVLALYWYLVRFRVAREDRAALATAGVAVALMLACEFAAYILFPEDLAGELRSSLDQEILQLWPSGLLVFFLAASPLELARKDRATGKARPSKGAAKPARRAAETR